MDEEGSNSLPLEQEVEAASTKPVTVSSPVEDNVDITADTQAVSLNTSTADIDKEGNGITDITEANISSTQNPAKTREEKCEGPTSVKRRRLETSTDKETDVSSDRRNLDGSTQEVETDLHEVHKSGDTKEASTETDGAKLGVETIEEVKASGDTDQGRGARKRKLPDDNELGPESYPLATSTYDRVRLVIQPWRKPEGGINKPIFKMMLESVMLHFMMKPGSGEQSLNDRYKPYLQPMVLKNIVNILIDIGCLTCHSMIKPKVSLFSEFHVEETDVEEGDDVNVCYLPTEDCLFKLGHFGKAFFPKAKWPESTVAT